MTIYWSLNSIPELAPLPRSTQGKVWRACYKNCWRHWQTWGGIALCALFALIGFTIPDFISPTTGASLSIWWRMITAAIFSGIGGFVFSQVAIVQTRPYLRAYIAAMGAASAAQQGN